MKPAAEQPVTLARIERALDRLAVLMGNDFGPYGNEGLVMYYDRLSQEAERLRAAQDTRSLARDRARRLLDQKAVRSSGARAASR